jgi:dTDP-4-dehydrorhamnose reductase
MKILLLGKNGQVGWECQRALVPLGEVVALSSASDDHCGDLKNSDGIAETIRRVRPDIIVNASAYTAVDKAESEPEIARTINAVAPGVLAREAAESGAWLVHYSTDYVFDGSGDAAWSENDPTGPLSVYGTTKLEGERAIQDSGCRHLIFRTSWVYASRGSNFAKTMLRLAWERERLTVVADQFGAPTGADLIADVTAHAIRSSLSEPRLGGIYHLVADGVTTWHRYASLVVDTAREAGEGIKAREVAPIPSSAFPAPAQRPANSRLATAKLRAAFGLTLPPWEFGVKRMLAEILER